MKLTIAFVLLICYVNTLTGSAKQLGDNTVQKIEDLIEDAIQAEEDEEEQEEMRSVFEDAEANTGKEIQRHNKESSDNGLVKNKVRRGFRSYEYFILHHNYLDEKAMSVCASVAAYRGYVFAVKRKCGEKATCQQICTSNKVAKQVKRGKNKPNCAESLHIWGRRPHTKDTDVHEVHRVGLMIYRYHSCNRAGCGPNFCCCTKY